MVHALLSLGHAAQELPRVEVVGPAEGGGLFLCYVFGVLVFILGLGFWGWGFGVGRGRWPVFVLWWCVGWVVG